jgi:hypothetical protein
VKEIPLTQGQIALIDDEDWELISQYRWHAGWLGGAFYAKSNVNYTATDGRRRQKTLMMHRLIMGGGDGSLQVDHRNGDTLDNRRSNLRWATRSQQRQNSVTPRSSSVRFKGVTSRPDGKWRARITVSGKVRHLGLFDTKQDAALAYNQKASELFGEFARLNVV